MPSVETVDDGAVRTVAINRPERRNALDFASLVAGGVKATAGRPNVQSGRYASA